MDNNVLVALIAAGASITTTTVTVFGNRTHQGISSNPGYLTFPGKKIFLALIIAGLAFYLFERYGHQTNQQSNHLADNPGKGPNVMTWVNNTSSWKLSGNTFLPDATFEAWAGNGSVKLAFSQDLSDVDKSIPRYINGSSSGFADRSQEAITQILEYDSVLDGDTAYTICHFAQQAGVNVGDDDGVSLVLFSSSETVIEIGIKDVTGFEYMSVLLLKTGWGVYEVPFASFNTKNSQEAKPFNPTHESSLNHIQLAFSRDKKSAPHSSVKIAKIEAFHAGSGI